jgi:hypothetical protein
MKTIPIGKAFSAMLWVIEKEQSVPENEMIGGWNFYDHKAPLKPINYSALVNTLGHDYFDGSLYQGISESINLTNAVDGGMLLTPENELVCQSKSESLGEGVEAWFNYEVESQMSRLAHTDIYPKDETFKPEKITKSASSADEISKEDLELLKYLSSPEASRKLAEMEKLRQANKQQGIIPNIPVTGHDKLIAKSHYKLLDLLQSGKFSAYYYPAIIKFKGELKLKEKPTQQSQVISKAHWQRNLLPHYDHNAIHFGDSHKLYFSRHVMSEGFTGEDEISPYHQFWLANVQIEAESFDEFIMPLIYRQFPLPKTAGLNRTGNKYIINFGADKNIEIKQSKGLNLLRMLIRHTNSNPQNQTAIPSFLLQSLLSKEEDEGELSRFVNDEPNYDDRSAPVINNSKNAKKDIRIRISTIRKQIKKYWDSEYLDIAQLKGLEKDITRNAFNISALTQDSNYADNIKYILNAEESAEYSKDDLLDTIFPSDLAGSASGDDNNENKELTNGMWNTMKAGMKLIKQKCPYLYFHLYGSGTSDKNGGFKGALRMDGNGFIYQPSDRIVWDLKER